MRLKSGVVSIELHCRDVLRTNFDPVNICPFDTFLKNTLVPINSKLNSNSYDNLHKHCRTISDYKLVHCSTPTTYDLRPETRHRLQQSSQYDTFLSRARGQCLNRVAK